MFDSAIPEAEVSIFIELNEDKLGEMETVADHDQTISYGPHHHQNHHHNHCIHHCHPYVMPSDYLFKDKRKI